MTALGVAAVLHCLELLKGRDLACDVTAVFAVQEELGCRGAQTAAFPFIRMRRLRWT